MGRALPANRHEFSLLDYLSLLRKRWLWFLLAVVVTTGLSVVYASQVRDHYEARAAVLVAETASQRALDPAARNAGILTRELSNEILLAESSAVRTGVDERLGDLPEVDIEAAPGADALFFKARADDPASAALFANTWAEMYVQAKQQEAVENIALATTGLSQRLDELTTERLGLQSQLDALQRVPTQAGGQPTAETQRQIAALEAELSTVTSRSEATASSLADLELQAELAAVGEARLIQVANPPLGPANRPPYLYVAMGVVIGVLSGIGLALLVDSLDGTVKTPGDVQAATNLPNLASVPAANRRLQHDPALATTAEPEGPLANAYHRVRSSVEFVGLVEEIESVLVTSANASEGKSTTSSNLALALSSTGRRVVLADVDFRRGRVHQIYQLDSYPGLSDVVLDGSEMHDIAHPVYSGGSFDLRVIPTGTVPPSPAAFIGTSGFRQAIEWIKDQSDIVVFDAPPLLSVPDALTLGQHADAVIVTAWSGRTKRHELTEVIDSLRQVNANVIGTVLIGAEGGDAYGYRAPASP